MAGQGHCSVAGKDQGIFPTGLWRAPAPGQAPTVTSLRGAVPRRASFNTRAAMRVHLRLHPSEDGGVGGPAAISRASLQWWEGRGGQWPLGDSMAHAGNIEEQPCRAVQEQG